MNGAAEGSFAAVTSLLCWEMQSNTNKGISVGDESLKVWSYWSFASGDTQRGQPRIGDHFRSNITFDVAITSYIRT